MVPFAENTARARIRSGGMGRDVFRFADPTDGTDTIKDFHSHVDKIAIDFVPGAPESLGADDFFFSTDVSGMTNGHAALIYDKIDWRAFLRRGRHGRK
jgi:hypothetical protein